MVGSKGGMLAQRRRGGGNDRPVMAGITQYRRHTARAQRLSNVAEERNATQGEKATGVQTLAHQLLTAGIIRMVNCEQSSSQARDRVGERSVNDGFRCFGLVWLAIIGRPGR